MRITISKFDSGEEISDPTLEKLLASDVPFVLNGIKLRERYHCLDEKRAEEGEIIREAFLFSDNGDERKYCGGGTFFNDFFNKYYYEARTGSKIFEKKEGDYGPRHLDKLTTVAGHYDFEGTMQELINEFKKRGYSFKE